MATKKAKQKMPNAVAKPSRAVVEERAVALCHHCATPASRDPAGFGPSGTRFYRCDNLSCPAPQLPYRWHALPQP